MARKKLLSFAERNAIFKAATKAGKASIIAQDVLLQLSLNNYRAETGEYFMMSVAGVESQLNLHDAIDTAIHNKEVNKKSRPVCTVCALGSAFASCVRYNNTAVSSTFSQGINGFLAVGSPESKTFSQMYDLLKVAFTADELNAMEFCFEQRDVRSQFSYEDRQLINLSTIGKACSETWDDNVRLVAIMKHIIKNSGRFSVKGLQLAPNNPNKE